MFMKLKQQASGWPSECDTEEERRTYLDDYKEHQGIELDPAKVEKNPGLRSLTKLMLNSFWGKFGQRPNQTQVTTCVKPSEFFNIITDDRQVVHRIEIANEQMVEVYHFTRSQDAPLQKPSKQCPKTKRTNSCLTNASLIMTPFDLSHMAINAHCNQFEFITIMNDTDHDDDDALDLELYCCKFYDKNIHVKHTHFLIVPTDKDNTTIHIHYDLDVPPNNEVNSETLDTTTVVSSLYH